MNAYKKLRPQVRTAEFIGGTGDGKTEIAITPASPEARTILKEGIGKTNSTLSNHYMVYTTEYTDKLVVAVKLNPNPISRNYFSELLSRAMAKIIKGSGKVIASVVGKDEEDLVEALYEGIAKKNNVNAVMSFLTEDQVEQFIQNIAKLHRKYKLGKNSYNIYNTVKNSLADTEVKESSKKFLAALQSEVEKSLDMMQEDFKDDLWGIWKSVNDELKKVFFTYFCEKYKSEDDYYYKEINLDDPDSEFIAAMFTANDIQGGQKLSLEVLCSEIVIYCPMNEKIADVIRKNETANRVFRDSFDNIVFGVLDTRGLYHANNTDDENSDYCAELIFRGDIDAIIMVVPLFGDSNEKKISELYREVLKDFNKQIPIFMIHNKLDLLIDSLSKDDFDDPLSTDPLENNELDESVILKEIKSRMEELNEDLRAVQTKAKKRLTIRSLACYLKRDKSFPIGLVGKYNILNVYEIILNEMAKNLEEDAQKIHMKLKEGQDAEPEVDQKQLGILLHQHVMDEATDKKVFTPGMTDVARSLGKTPHGNAYNALRRRLKNGDGYTSNIDEGYYYNCQSFAVNFTANLRNFASPQFIHSLVYQVLSIDGAKFKSQEDGERFNKLVESYINPKELVSILLYDHAIQNAETKAFSFKWKFQSFLQNSLDYFNMTVIDEEAYKEALTVMLHNAAEKAISLNVSFRQPK